MASILHTVRDLGRLREIAGVLARHGFGELVERTGLSSLAAWKSDRTSDKTGIEAKSSTAVRMRRVLEELGPSFVKLGQIISTRPDLVPAEITEELQRLQDDVPPVAFEAMRVELEQQLGASIGDVFIKLDEAPMASASIGQVYRATLRTEVGDHDVVVKIQRPNISSTIERDIDLLYWLAHAIERSVPDAKVYAPVKLVDEFQRAISAELDYAQEADNAERFAANFADLPTVVFPKVFRQASSRKVITLSYIPGDNVFTAVANGADAERIAKTSVEVMIRMIFEHGFFHADPHPGNILIAGTLEAPLVGLIDLGLVGRISPKMRDRLIDLVTAAGREDHRAIADALYTIGRPTKKIDRAAFELEVMRLSDKYLHRRLGDIQFSEFVRDLARGALRYGIEVPPDFMMVGKALMTVDGMARQIYPKLDVVAEVKPYVANILGARYSPERITNDLLHLASRLGSTASELPALADDILEDLRQGRLTLEVRQESLQHAQDRLGRRVFTGLVLSATIIGASLLVAMGHALAGWAMLTAAAGWGVLHTIAMALSKNTPRR
jgi:ubiquinone biosynthesis protein